MKPDRKGLVVRIQIKDESGRVVGETDAVTMKGLLSLAHHEGLRSVRTRLVQVPTADNDRTAIVRSVVRTEKGTFTGIGDANPGNVNRRIAPHIVRMAETRATARALRLAVNIGEVAIEELADDVAIAPTTAPESQRRPKPNGSPLREPAAPRQDPRPPRGRDPAPTQSEPSDVSPMSREQRKLLFRLAFEGGATNDSALGIVLDALRVGDLEQATRSGASTAIDRLMRQVRGNGDARRVETQHGP